MILRGERDVISISAIAAALLAVQSAQAPAAPPSLDVSPAPAPTQAVLAAGTPVLVTLDQDLTTLKSMVGDIFEVTVAQDVVEGTTVIIPRGTVGHGEVTFVTKRGGFGKGGIIGISLRDLRLGDRRIALDGHYREEGKSRTGATAATFFAVGIFSGFIKGNDSGIPKGRDLRARTGEDVAYTPGAAPPAPPARAPEPTASATEAPVASTAPASSATASTHH